MSESSISKRQPDPAVRVSTTDNHRLLTPAGQAEPKRPQQRQPHPAQRRAPLADTGKGRARPAAPPPPAPPSGVVLGQSATVFSTVSKGARVSLPPRPTTAHGHLEHRERDAAKDASAALAAQLAEHERSFGLFGLDDAELALVGQLVQTFAASAGGEGLRLAQSVASKIAAEVEARDASEPAEPGDHDEPEALPEAPKA